MTAEWTQGCRVSGASDRMSLLLAVERIHQRVCTQNFLASGSSTNLPQLQFWWWRVAKRGAWAAFALDFDCSEILTSGALLSDDHAEVKRNSVVRGGEKRNG